MARTLEGKRVASLFTDGVEQVELTEPLDAVRKAGAQVDLVSLEQGPMQMFNHLERARRSKLITALRTPMPQTTTGS